MLWERAVSFREDIPDPNPGKTLMLRHSFQHAFVFKLKLVIVQVFVPLWYRSFRAPSE